MVKYTPLSRTSRKTKLIIAVVGIAIVVALIVVIVIAKREKGSAHHYSSPTHHKRTAQKFKKAAVAADSKVCSKIGADVLRKNGSAAESAIATLICSGVANPQSTGIGGGAFLVLYERAKKKFTTYDFREQAPLAANETMYVNQTGASTYGGPAVAVPGMVKGLYLIYQKHGGNLPWADLVQPSIDLAESMKVSEPLAKAIQRATRGKISSGLKSLFTNEKGEYLKEGDTMRNPELARTLRIIQNNGSYDFYYGELARNITRDLQAIGGVINMEDLKKYTVSERQVFQLELSDGDMLNTMPLPGGGPIVAMMLNIMSGYKFENIDLSNSGEAFGFWQRFLESMKFAYAQRGLLGDPDFVPVKNITRVLNLIKNKTAAEHIRKNKISLDKTHDASYYGGFWGKDDFGTSHMSLIAENGDAVSATGTLNLLFGSKFRSSSTGIIFNNEMDDFSTPGQTNAFGYPPSPANYIVPGKRPLSSMSPSIVTDRNGDVKIVTGAAGGSRIISATATVILKALTLDMEFGEAVASYRLHNQGLPNDTFYFQDVEAPSALLDRLRSVGHTVTASGGKSIVQAVLKKDDHVYAMTDPRKESNADGY